LLGWHSGNYQNARLKSFTSLDTNSHESHRKYLRIKFKGKQNIAGRFWFAFMNMAQPLFTNFAMQKVNHDEQPFVNALLVIAWSAGWGASASIGGLLIERFSYTIPFFITSFLYLVSTLVIFSFFKEEQLPNSIPLTPSPTNGMVPRK
jgi:hypothetical protein